MANDQDSPNPVEAELVKRQLEDISGFADPETGAVTDRGKALAWVNEQAPRHGLEPVRERLAAALDGVAEPHQGDYLQILTMVCRAQKDWDAAREFATRAEHLHSELGDPARAANAVVHRVETLNADGDHDAALKELELALDYVREASELPEDSDERAAVEAVLADVRNGYGETQQVALRGLWAGDQRKRVAEYCQQILEDPAFKEEEAALLTVMADLQAEVEEDYAGSMATMRRLEAVGVEMGRFDIAAHAALGQAALSVQRFESISAPDDYRRGAAHLQSYGERPDVSPERFRTERDLLLQVRKGLMQRRLLQ